MGLIRLIWLMLPVLLSGCVNDDVPGGKVLVSVGDKLPDFSVILADGTPISRDELKGQTSVIVFFNTSCEDCRRELPVIDQVSRVFAGKTKFIAIAREEDDESIMKFWDAEGLSLPYSPQPGRGIYSLFAKSGIPQIFISDASLTIRAIFGPDDCPGAETLSALIESMEDE